MNTIKIYLNNGQLTCDLIENNNTIVRRYEGTSVDKVINALTKERIVGARTIDNTDNPKTMVVRYDNFKVELHNLEILYRQENSIVEYIDLIKTTLETRQIQRVKNSNQSKKNKVERQNKYKKSIIRTTSIALTIVLMMTLGYIKKDKNKYDFPENDGYLVVENINPPTHIGGMTTTIQLPSQIEQPTMPIEQPKSITSIPLTPSEQIPETEENNVNIYPVAYIEYEDRSDTSKAKNTRERYGKIISKYANMYGLDANLMIALATQERGTHSETMDRGGATGLMQIQNSVWVGQTISGYNFETGKIDKIKITEENIGDLETNIRIGCMCFQNCLDMSYGNILIALQMYNFGYGNMSKVITTYAYETNQTKEEIYANQYDIGWLEYTNIIQVGDSNYVKNVLSWLGRLNQLAIKRKTSGDRSVTVSCNPEYQQEMQTSGKRH